MRLDPGAQESRRHRQPHRAVFRGVQLHAAEPAGEHILAELITELVLDPLPALPVRARHFSLLFSSKVRVQPSNSGEAGPTMPALANATDIARGVVRVPINRSQPPIGGELGSAAGLGGARLKRDDKRPMHSGQRDSGQRRAHRYCQWLDCRHHAPTSIAPSSMVVTDCRAGSSTRPSEAACAFHPLATPINRFSR